MRTRHAAQQAEYFLYVYDTNELRECDLISAGSKQALVLFKENCYESFGGACTLLEAFSVDCLAQLGDEPDEFELCSLEGAPITCENERPYVLGLPEEAMCPMGQFDHVVALSEFNLECDWYARPNLDDLAPCKAVYEFSSVCLGESTSVDLAGECARFSYETPLTEQDEACVAQWSYVLGLDDSLLQLCEPAVPESGYWHFMAFRGNC
eukprot:CAMPEP_0172635346 /NCGR_PEP_ID=MMETSP1068-20121228/198987_1 /TAXON_ID=35684 /ORGANISM="Pseudopedinella elastica, Strain CCMP716" /LENGTH=208 /DNA_ID=CAMNT_0013447535 /DNA_START=220 /DNA_END=842 /DNA_ORIENTATION=-